MSTVGLRLTWMLTRGIARAAFTASPQFSPLQQAVRTSYAFNTTMNDMASVKSIVDSKIQGKKVMVFSKSTCPFCTKAKKVFQELIKSGGLSTEDYEVMEIENDPNCGAIQSYLGSLTGESSVPRVFVNQKCIGGGDEVVSKHQSGQLVKLLQLQTAGQAGRL